jgi:hypothetical protein
MVEDRIKELPMISGVERPLHDTYVIVYNIIKNRFEEKFKLNFINQLKKYYGDKQHHSNHHAPKHNL